MRKDAKIALCVILALMVLVVVIWGRSQTADDLAPPQQSEQDDRAGATTIETEPDDALPASDPATSPSTGLAAADESSFSTPAAVPPSTSYPSTAPSPAPHPTAMINHWPTPDPEPEPAGTRDTANDLLADGTRAGTDLTGRRDREPAATFRDMAAGRASEPAPAPEPTTTHKITKGDTYQGLARKYYKDATKWRLIYEANKIPPEKLAIDKVIRIPSLPATTPTTATTGRARARTERAGKGYKVKKGENFITIARVHYRDGGKWRKIYEANRSKLPDPENPASLRAGTVITIPSLASLR